jgi:hypothetical protein
LRDHEDEYQAFEYNVHVGQGIKHQITPVPGADPAFLEAAAETYRLGTQKRIDVVGHRGDTTVIIEVDERPGPRSLGQLLLYRNLLLDARDIKGPVELMLVCRRMGPDMLSTLDEHDVTVWQQAPPGG